MTQLAISDTPPKMGRPPLKKSEKTVATQIRLPFDMRARIEAVAGENRMAVFIREAIEAELIRRERSK